MLDQGPESGELTAYPPPPAIIAPLLALPASFSLPTSTPETSPRPCLSPSPGLGELAHESNGGILPFSPLKRTLAVLDNDELAGSEAFDIEHACYDVVGSLLEQALIDTRFVFVEVWTVKSKSVQAASAQASSRADTSRQLSVTNHTVHANSTPSNSGSTQRIKNLAQPWMDAAGGAGVGAQRSGGGGGGGGGGGVEHLLGGGGGGGGGGVGAGGGGDEVNQVDSHKVHKMGRKTRRKMRQTLKTAAMPLIKNMVGAKTSLIAFTGVKKVKKSFLKMSIEEGSFYDAKNVDVIQHLAFLEKLGVATRYKQGEGLPGMAWARGTKGETEWHILEDLRNDPEMVFNERLAATVPLFHSSIGVPVFDLANPKMVTNILLFYLPHELKSSPGKQIEYLDGKTNPKLAVYLKHVASTFAIATHWQDKALRWGKVRAYAKTPTSKRAEQLWRKLRIAVTTGLLRPTTQVCKRRTKWHSRFHRLSKWSAKASTLYCKL